MDGGWLLGWLASWMDGPCAECMASWWTELLAGKWAKWIAAI